MTLVQLDKGKRSSKLNFLNSHDMIKKRYSIDINFLVVMNFRNGRNTFSLDKINNVVTDIKNNITKRFLFRILGMRSGK